jgi:hypothetical protein
MGLWKKLTGCLTKVVDLSQYSSFHSWIRDTVNVDCPIICEVIKHVRSFNCSLAALLITKDKIDPVVKIL